MSDLDLYQGGRTVARGPAELPRYRAWNDDENPAHYVPEPGLRDAVNVALALGQPLLLTGEPGTGKTQLAWSLAYDLGLGDPLVFDTKTTTAATDLFYHYDALRHFRDAQMGRNDMPVRGYVEFQALGLAILRAMDPEQAAPYLPPEERGLPKRRSVVLVDEIDKAPRDVPNDLLREVVEMRFRVREAASGEFPPELKADPEFRPIVVLTSNSEKNLPDAFLRRCVFYHLDFPGEAALRRIVELRLGRGDGAGRVDAAAVQEFLEIRKLPLKKAPATAELLAWVRVLRDRGIDPRRDPERAAPTFTVLAKTVEDLRRLRERAGLAAA
ncbi:MAG TPA: MoxR family ATPase [Longimicrobium sp.]|nr:MoxR family ATPase [Longimicrobium sp.]